MSRRHQSRQTSHRRPGSKPKEAHWRQPEWLSFLEEQEWNTFCEVTRLTTEAGIPVLLGGGLGLAAYMPLRRRTKDLDFYVLPESRDAMIALLDHAGFRDFYDQLPYDRGWIYRGVRGEVIADVIWSFANYLTAVDEDWFRHSRTVACDGFPMRIVPPEELIWSKLFVFQRERCDWPDILNLLYYAGPTLDWERLRARLGPNVPILESVLSVFHWLCPGGPGGVGQVNPIPMPVPKPDPNRVRLLDSRDWFLPQMARTARATRASGSPA